MKDTNTHTGGHTMNEYEFRCSKCHKMGTAEEILKDGHFVPFGGCPSPVSTCCDAEIEFPLGGAWPNGTRYERKVA